MILTFSHLSRVKGPKFILSIMDLAMFLLMTVTHVIPKKINPEFMNAYSFITFLMVAFSLFLDKSLRKAWRINDN